jgi:hypothetical protein
MRHFDNEQCKFWGSIEDINLIIYIQYDMFVMGRENFHSVLQHFLQLSNALGLQLFGIKADKLGMSAHADRI